MENDIKPGQSVSDDGVIRQDEDGLFCECPACGERMEIDTDFPDDPRSADMSGTCESCGCNVDADKTGIWGFST